MMSSQLSHAFEVFFHVSHSLSTASAGNRTVEQIDTESQKKLVVVFAVLVDRESQKNGCNFCRIVEKIGCGFCRRRRLSHNWISGLPDECGDVYAYHYCKDPNARANTMNVINAFLVHLALALIWPTVRSLGSWLLNVVFLYV